MKNIRLTCGMLAFSVLLTFSACQKEDSITPMDTTEFAALEYQFEDLDGLENPEVTEATETQPFGVRDDRKENTDRKGHDTHTLGFILRHLNLDERQRQAVKGFVEQQSGCVAEHRTKVQERHRELVKKANTVREDYVKAYRAGRITREQLNEKLSTLRARLQEQLHKDEHKQIRMRILQKCRTELMGNIASVLNREQLQKWNRWQESQK